jgi:hypothetical protein
LSATTDRVTFSHDGATIAVTSSTSPRIHSYPWSGSGFGTKYANPISTIPATARGVSFNPPDDALAVAHQSGSFVSVYAFSAGFGTKFANPSPALPGNGLGTDFSPDGAGIVIGHSGGVNVSGYAWSVTGFGTKFANPGTAVPQPGSGVRFTR